MYKVGDIIESYWLLSECGSGAYGTVFKAENSVTGKLCALKVFYTHDRHYDRELKGLINYQHHCRHRNLMPVHHVGQLGDCIYYTMDLADNLLSGDDYLPDTLANRLNRNGRFQPNVVLKMTNEILDGLEALHSNGLIHRDIKPDNILWVNGEAVLADIGLVSLGGPTTLTGTPGFISPAVISGERQADIQNDLYALGKVVYCALTGSDVRKFPDFPQSQTLTEAGRLVHTYTVVCEKASLVKSVPDFRRYLQADKAPAKYRRSILWRVFPPLVIVLMLLLLFIWKFLDKPRVITTTEEVSQPEEQITDNWTPHNGQYYLKLYKKLAKQYASALDMKELELRAEALKHEAASAIRFNPFYSPTEQELEEAEKLLKSNDWTPVVSMSIKRSPEEQKMQNKINAEMKQQEIRTKAKKLGRQKKIDLYIQAHPQYPFIHYLQQQNKINTTVQELLQFAEQNKSREINLDEQYRKLETLWKEQKSLENVVAKLLAAENQSDKTRLAGQYDCIRIWRKYTDKYQAIPKVTSERWRIRETIKHFLPESLKENIPDPMYIGPIGKELTDHDIDVIRRHFKKNGYSLQPVLEYIEVCKAYTKKHKLLLIYCNQVNTHMVKNLEELSDGLYELAQRQTRLESEILNSDFARRLPDPNAGYAKPKDHQKYQEKYKAALHEYAKPPIITPNRQAIMRAAQQIGFSWESRKYEIEQSPISDEIRKEALNYLNSNPDIPRPENLNNFARQYFLEKEEKAFYQNHKYYPVTQYSKLCDEENSISFTFEGSPDLRKKYTVEQLETQYQKLLLLLKEQKALEPQVLNVFDDLLPPIMVWDREQGKTVRVKREY